MELASSAGPAARLCTELAALCAEVGKLPPNITEAMNLSTGRQTGVQVCVLVFGFVKSQLRFSKVEPDFTKVKFRFSKIESDFSKIKLRFTKIEFDFGKVELGFVKTDSTLAKSSSTLPKLSPFLPKSNSIS